MPTIPRRQVARSPLARAIRYAGFILGGIIGWALGAELPGISGDDRVVMGLLTGTVLAGICFILAPYVTVGLFRWLQDKLEQLDAADIVAAGVGLIVGGLFSALLALPASFLPSPLGQVLPFLIAVAVCTLSVVVLVVQKERLLPMLVRRAVPSEPEERLLLDTSVLIDGRIVELMRTGLVSYPLIVPRFVLRELQAIADSEDAGRRVRGRRGLESLERLQRESTARLDILETEVPEERDVDSKLVRLARLGRYHILTGDQNLERVARLQDVLAININTVANALRPPVVPGEELELEIVQPGREVGQGIGYLDDGTLIVVEEGRDLVGQQVRVVVTRTLQTGTGRMAFAHVKDEVPA